MTRYLSFVFVVLFGAWAQPTLAQSTALVMDSDPGDYIGGGQNYYYTPANGTFTASKNYSNGVSISFSNGSHNWHLDFGAPGNAPLTVQVYNNATRFAFHAPGEPGLDISGDGRGCNEIAGSFEVKEIVYGSGTSIAAFHAKFTQHCEGGGPALVGEVLYFSSDPYPPVEHITSSLTAFGTRNQPFQYQIRASNHPTGFTATNLPSGLTVNPSTGLISGAPTAEGNFLVTIGATGANGPPGASDTLNLTIDPPGQSTGGYTALFMTSDSGDYIGAGQNYYYTPNDGSFTASNSGSSAAQINFQSTNPGVWWTPSFRSPTGTIMDLGTYFGASRFSSAANPGIDVSGSGRGCNSTTGMFEVKELNVVAGRVVSYRGTFVQHCEGGVPALRGEVWFNSPRAITSNPRPLATRDQAFSYQIVGNNSPTTFAASALPPGLSIDSATGLMSGTPTMGGKFSVPVSATGPNDTASDRILLVVGLPSESIPAPVITSLSTAEKTVNQAFSYQITATNSPTSFSASGLPAGLVVNPNTGLISGAATVTGTFDAIISASNAGGTGGSSLTLSIYPPTPVINSPNSATAIRSQPFSFQVTASNQPTGFSMDGQPSGLTLNATSGLLSGTPTQAGSYNMIFRATNGSGTTFQSFFLTVAAPTPTPTPTPSPTATPATPTPTATPTPATTATPTPAPTATPTATPGSLGNISTRLRVLGSDNALIGGMIATGTASKKVIIRAIGPTLTDFGVPGALENPTLDLYQGNTLVTSNDDWRQSPQQAEIQNSGLAPGKDAESAVIATLTPNLNYTAIVRGKDGTTGVGVVEAFDLEQGSASKLGNISTRGFVDVDDNVMIAGLIVSPSNGTSSKVLVRALGPTLGDFGVANALANPTLDLVNSSGTVIRSNDNWKSDQRAEIEAANLAPSHDEEAALVETITPGAYTAVVRGLSRTTGVGLVEVYNIQ